MIDNPALLPPGFQDILPEESTEERFILNAFSETFSSFGYKYVKPPLMEYEHGFLDNAMGRKLGRKMFRLMDPVSKNMLGIRADITSQIVRIAMTRLVNMPRPLRIFYAADSFNIESPEIKPQRQFTQVGCELFGSADLNADIEICTVAVLALKKIGIEDVTIDFCFPSLLKNLLHRIEEKFAPKEYEVIRKCIDRRDKAGITQFKDADIETLNDLIELSGPIENIENKYVTNLDEDTKARINTLRETACKIKKEIDALGISDVQLKVDLLEMKDFEYHSGIAFGFYTSQSGSILGRGGRYEGQFKDARTLEPIQENAVGFTFYTHALRDAVKEKDESKQIYVHYDTDWKTLQKLHNDGYQTIRALSDEDYNETNAALHGCEYMYMNKDVIKLDAKVTNRVNKHG